MSITLDQITKRYQGVPVVNDVSLEVGDGEFFVLLGPSGSGKSTLLRAIAGLTGIDHGRISLHGRDVTHLSARERGVGLVFQNYALFRHMTVADNIEFALRVRRMKAAERRQRRQELLKLVSLEGMDYRLPAQLSGGQQQRVAVARALAHKPEVLLLDEPFGALDAMIREELRRTIRQVQRELGITTVLVTHDQEEAFALADHIGVMNHGRLLEVGRPEDLYIRPMTRFVATFLGTANLLLAHQTAQGVRLGNTLVQARVGDPGDGHDHEIVAVLRPEDVEIAATREQLASRPIAQGTVEEIVFTGVLERMRVRLDASSAAQLRRADTDAAQPVIEVTRTQHEQRGFRVSQGQTVAMGVRRIHVLPTPLSSFVVHANTRESAERLSQHPLLLDIATRMKTRIEQRTGSAADAPAGTSVARGGLSGTSVIGVGTGTAQQVERLLRDGAKEVLTLPSDAIAPHRVLIYWTDEAVRRATLAAAASLLRHVYAEAVYLGIIPDDTPETRRPECMRALLDARSEAHGSHGLQMRTEVSFGEPAEAHLTRRLREMPGQLLVLGITDPSSLSRRFGALFEAGANPVLIVHRAAPRAGVTALAEGFA